MLDRDYAENESKLNQDANIQGEILEQSCKLNAAFLTETLSDIPKVTLVVGLEIILDFCLSIQSSFVEMEAFYHKNY